MPHPDGHSQIRLFLSSTFQDMHAERDYLSRVVFPELRSRCRKRGADFVGFDLRWGVTEEEAEREGALAICLGEIERCRPFFVCLLGDRFGWVPPPDEIPLVVFDTLRDEGTLPADVAGWYALDETSDPPVYRLRRECGLQTEMADRLTRYWESKGLPLAGESITAREILRGVFEDGYPATRALFYLRKPGLTQHPEFLPSLVPFFIEQDARRRQKLSDLKDRIRSLEHLVTARDYEVEYAGLRVDPSVLPPKLTAGEREALEDGVVAPHQWSLLSEPLRRLFEAHGTVALKGLEALGEQILADVWPAIEVELQRPVEQPDAHARERAYHERFVREQTRLFLGRPEQLQRVSMYVSNPTAREPMIVSGAPGAGKSAFMAEAVRRCRESHPDALVVPHFVGAAPGSAALSATLRSLCETLRRGLSLDDDVAADPEKLRQQFSSLMTKAGPQRAVIVFLDALDQLDPAGRSHELDWLPYSLSAGVKLIVSAQGDCLHQFHRRRRSHASDDVEIPALPDRDSRGLIQQFLHGRHKKLTPAQVDNLLDTTRRPDANLPLYLLVALEELCLFGNHHALSQRIDRLPGRLPELFDQLLARLEHDHGRALTGSICSWLAVSRSGLLESEILDLAGQDSAFRRIHWASLHRALEPYLKPIEEGEGIEHGVGLLDYYHDQLRFAALRRYLGMHAPDTEASEASRAAHRQLAAYFRDAARDTARPREWRSDAVRSLQELAYHQTRGAMWEELESTLCDLDFITARCAAGMTYDLVADYDAALAVLPEAREEQERLRQLDERVARYAREMVEYARHWTRPRDGQQQDRSASPLRRAAEVPIPEPPAGFRPWTDQQNQADTERTGEAKRFDRLRAFSQFVSVESRFLTQFASVPGFCLQQAYNAASAGAVARAAEIGLAASSRHQELLLLRLERRRPAWSQPLCLRTMEDPSMEDDHA